MGPASSLSCFSPYKKILSGLPKKGRAYLLVVLVPREGQDFDLGDGMCFTIVPTFE